MFASFSGNCSSVLLSVSGLVLLLGLLLNIIQAMLTRKCLTFLLDYYLEGFLLVYPIHFHLFFFDFMELFSKRS